MLQNCLSKRKILHFFKIIFWNVLKNVSYDSILVESTVFKFRFSVAFWTEISAETESLNDTETETETETHTETEISAETETKSFRSLLRTN
jgi:hypothetical protein